MSAVSFEDAIIAVSRLLKYGEWTTYGEVAAAAGRVGAARVVGRLAAGHPAFANAHRVLGAGGRLAQAGTAAAARRRRALEAEGVVFTGVRADPARRVGWNELRGRLAEVTSGPRSGTRRRSG
jgi:alkylated DNA nucleotide flippase Atl1